MCVALAAAPERVRIGAVVTDRQGRTISGLTVKDFELRVDGVVQQIENVEPRGEAPRRIAILLDEFHVDAADAPLVRDAVSAFVSTRLRPDDKLVVLKPLDPLMAIRLTNDRDESLRAIAAFAGRNGVYEPRTKLEEDTLGRAPALVESGRAQVVLSALRALTSQLGAAPGRSAILLVSNGFVEPGRSNVRGLPDLANVERFANRYDVPIYAFDPRTATPAGNAASETAIDKLVSETGGTFYRGTDLPGSLSRTATELDGGYTLTYTPAHDEDGKFHPVQVSVARTVLAKAGGADARARAGYISALPPDLRRGTRASDRGPLLTTRMIHHSPLISVWSGVTHVDSGLGHIAVTWLPAATSAPVQITLKATTGDGQVLFEGFVSPVRVGEPPNDANPDRVEFVAPSGKVQIDMTIIGGRGQKLDVDARDVEVPAAKGATAVILPPIMISTHSAREFRAVAADQNAAPDPARQFRRTDRVLIRVPAYAAGQAVPVTARLLNRVGQVLASIPALPDSPRGVTQFDLSLAPLAPGDYFLQFTTTGPTGQVDQRVPFKITG